MASGSAREVTAGEQHTHRFLKTLPFVLVGMLAASNWPRPRSTWQQPSSWRLRRRDVPLPARCLLAVAAILTATGAIPYAEELARCLGHRQTAPTRGLRGYSQVVSRHRDQNAEDDGHPNRGGVDRHPPEGPHSGDGKPTGEKQAAANRENDPPA